MTENKELPFIPLFIGGTFRPATTDTTFDVRNPATGQVVEHAAAASAQDCQLAIEAAGNAFDSWKATTPAFKSNILRKVADLIISARFQEKIIQIATQETGVPPQTGALTNITAIRDYILAAAEGPYEAKGEILPSDFGAKVFVEKRPLGVIFIISPWNSPLGLSLITTLPALAAGNTVVHKTSENSPGTQLIAAELLKEAGIPDGVFNVIHTAKEDAASRVAEIIAHPLIRKIGFTGSDHIGRIIATEAAKYLKPVILELGGKAPAIVLNDAKIDVAARGIIAGALLHSGQLCLSTERVIVQREVSTKLIECLKAVASKLKAGDVNSTDARLGPLFNENAAKEVVSMIKEAVDGGAQLLLGDLKHVGAFVQPHIVLGTKPGTRLWDRESFGPVITIAIVDTVDEAIELANASNYSLTSSLWTSDMQKAFDIASRIYVDKVNVNGMTMSSEPRFHQEGKGGSSGYGKFCVDSFLHTQLISFQDPEKQMFPLVDF